MKALALLECTAGLRILIWAKRLEDGDIGIDELAEAIGPNTAAPVVSQGGLPCGGDGEPFTGCNGCAFLQILVALTFGE